MSNLSTNNDSVVSKNDAASPSVNAFSDFSIGGLLLRMGKITPEDAERIMRLHKERGMRFGEAAQSLGLITEADIQQVLAKQFDYPYLVPEHGTYQSELFAAYQPFSAQVETLRAARSQLILHWFSLGRKAICFSSANSGEGTSNLVANLAVVFSQLGQTTLVIDANLRQPRQHAIFNIQEKMGLSDILADRASANVIAKIPTFENLSVLVAGTIPPNPQELVSRDGFKSLLKGLSEQYDVILIDTPSFAGCADAHAISMTVGGVVIAVRKNQARLADVDAMAEILKNSGTQIVGSILLDY